VLRCVEALSLASWVYSVGLPLNSLLYLNTIALGGKCSQKREKNEPYTLRGHIPSAESEDNLQPRPQRILMPQQSAGAWAGSYRVREPGVFSVELHAGPGGEVPVEAKRHFGGPVAVAHWVGERGGSRPA